jgi:hypothetical protein
MNFRILGGITKGQPQNYRGQSRTTPYYCEEMPHSNKVNQLFFWYCDEGGEDGTVHDLKKATELVEAYAKLDPPQFFEIVEITKNGEPAKTKSEFLGFDLSSGGYSLLGWGLDFVFIKPHDVINDEILDLILPLLQLVQKHFQPELNKYGLFSEYKIAKFCLDCMISLQQIRPGLWENEDVKFEVIGVWEVLSTNSF